jgi:hypothetical protein
LETKSGESENIVDDLILSFKNDSVEDLIIVVDPPCIDFILRQGSLLKLVIHNYRKAEVKNVSDIIDIRYEDNNIVNIDVNYNFEISVIIHGDKSTIWKR